MIERNEQSRPDEQGGLNDKWFRGEENTTDASDIQAERGRQQSDESVRQFGDRGGRAEGSGASGPDDDKFRTQERGGKNPGDSY